MKPFRFRLARLLGVRKIAELDARGRYSELEGRARTGESARDELERAILAALAETKAARTLGALDPKAALAEALALDRLRQGLAVRRERAAKLRGAAQAAFSSWTLRRQDVEALERLEERARLRHRDEVERRSQAEIDERAGWSPALKPGAAPTDDSFDGRLPAPAQP